MSTRSTGRTFEEEVADLYVLMGYHVERNIDVCGQEVDILASKPQPGSEPFRVLVECKFRGKDQLSGNDHVQSIAKAFFLAKGIGQVSACTIVTTNGFSPSAQIAAKAAGIHLTTKSGLLRNLIDFTSYKQRIVEEFELDFGDSERCWFIPPTGKRIGAGIEPLNELVDLWLESPNKRPLALLGGYGTGKSSFCRQYAYRLVKQGNDLITPLIINLRDFTRTIRIESLIRDFLEETCGVTYPNFDLVRRMYEEGYILFLLDGFDEMASRVDRTILEINLVEIERLTKASGHAILTCRPELFISSKEQLEAFSPDVDFISDRRADYDIIELDLWDEEKVTDFIRKRISAADGVTSEMVEKQLKKVREMPALRNVSTRPVHLELIVRMLPVIIEKASEISSIKLFESYLVHEFRREKVQNRRIKIISDEERILLMQKVAADSFLRGGQKIDFVYSSAIIQKSLSIPRIEAEAATRDFLNRSFMVRKGDEFVFAHKSIGEFLLAKEIYGRIRDREFSFLNSGSVTGAVAGMTLEHFGGLERFPDLAASLDLQSGEEIGPEDLLAVDFCILSLVDPLQSILSARRHQVGKLSELENIFYFGLGHDTMNALVGLRGAIDFAEMCRHKDEDRFAKCLLRINSIWPSLILRSSLLSRVRIGIAGSSLSYVGGFSSCTINSVIQDAGLVLNDSEVELPIEEFKCQCVRDLMVRVIENLLLNAQYAIGGRGKIRVETQLVESGASLAIRIINSGTIPEAIRDKIWDFGFTTREGGYGIGLPVARELTKVQGGTLELIRSDSETVFEISLWHSSSNKVSPA